VQTLAAGAAGAGAGGWQVWAHALNPLGAGITAQVYPGGPGLAVQADALAATPGIRSVVLGAEGPNTVQVAKAGDLERVARVVAARGVVADAVTTPDDGPRLRVGSHLRADEARNLRLAEPGPKTRWPADEGAPLCSPEHLVPFLGTGDGATGHQYTFLTAANTGDRPCAVAGYPALEFRDLAGRVLPLKLTHGSSFMARDDGARRIVVPPGASVRAELGWDSVAAGRADRYAVEVVVTVSPTAHAVELPASLRADSFGRLTTGAAFNLTAWKPNVFTS
jgi:hypothetical protein